MRARIFYLVVLATILQHVKSTIAAGSIDYPGNETDHSALLAIKSRLVDRDGVLSSWNHSLHHCNWEGVTCGHRHRRVTKLWLYSLGLSGTISPFIGNLSFLQDIRLFNNSLHGTIPSEIGRLFGLKGLYLQNNTLVGGIPSNLSGCLSLELLSLSRNHQLGGYVPKELGALSKLKYLYLIETDMSGPLFSVIQNLTSLEEIYVQYNAFTGTIPDSVAAMKNLTLVACAENYLSGKFPIFILNISSLQALELSLNRLEGNIPPHMHLKLPQMQFLSLSLNFLTGPFPITFLNLTSLQHLELSGNKFTGSEPLDFRHFQNLLDLDLSSMNLKGDINFITTLANSSTMQYLQLQANNFTGTFPKSVANLSKTLDWFDISQNQVTGEISSGIGDLSSLAFLDMSDNELTGTIPNEIGNLHKLERADFSSNKLTGRIPNSLGNLSWLTKLYLEDNNLYGSIPSNLGNCENLLYLSLYNNNLSGTLPNALFGGYSHLVQMDVSQNHLTGSLPQDISNQINLVHLDASENKLSGELPSSLGKCSALQYFNVSSNFIIGSIPSSFSALSSLQTLDLSLNKLSGPIPSYFSEFPLFNLNLSYNNFEGSVPEKGIYTNISVVSLVGNSRLCGGIPQLHLSRCMEQGKRKTRRRMSLALKLTIPIVCALGLLLTTAMWLFVTRRREKRDSISSNIAMGKGFLQVSYNMLLKATEEFSSSNILGAGTFGTVFKGVLDGKMVAVKVLNLQQQGATKSFLAECKVLRNTRHRNLVKIFTVCSSIDFKGDNFKALVYEFMPKGNLERWLHEAGNLTLLQRVEIAIDVAHALNYLHHENETPIVHCDLKPSNILLDDDMVAHVGDFGLAKMFAPPGSVNQSSSVGVKGTVGYTAPEYGLGNLASTDGDIYSYGTVLLELVTGKRPTDQMFEENVNLHTYAEAALPDQVLQIVDPMLQNNDTTEEVDNRRSVQGTVERRVECIVSMVSVGVACSNHLPHERMKITDVISRLQAARDNLLRAERRSRFYG